MLFSSSNVVGCLFAPPESWREPPPTPPTEALASPPPRREPEPPPGVVDLGVPVPKGVTNGRYLNPRFIDIMDAWKVGDYQASISLDRLAKHLGCGSKNGNGADFARLLVEDREAAMAYLENDIRMTLAVARKVGLVESEEDY
jgi:hypothetical protein